MNILMVGDVYGEPGRAAITNLLPKLRQQHAWSTSKTPRAASG